MSSSVCNKLAEYKPCDFASFIKDFGHLLEQDFEKILERTRVCGEDTKHTDIDKYLYNPLRKYLSNTGKMHRPLTCIAAYLACGGDVEKINSVLPVALSLEIFQSGALIHDDIADKSQLRRGKPCLHIQEGENIALNAGDLCMFMVTGHLLDGKLDDSPLLDDSVMIRILRELTYMEYMTVEGQALDLGWARDNEFDITTQDYLEMATKKTAYYSAALPCVLGAICANADLKTVKQLRNFGMKVGLSFQIQDDVINLVGSDNKKDFRSDIIEGKRTLCVVHALSNCDAHSREKLISILTSDSNNDTELSEAVEIMTKSGSIDYAKDQSKILASSAQEILDKCSLNNWRCILDDMANWAFTRCS